MIYNYPYPGFRVEKHDLPTPTQLEEYVAKNFHTPPEPTRKRKISELGRQPLFVKDACGKASYGVVERVYQVKRRALLKYFERSNAQLSRKIACLEAGKTFNEPMIELDKKNYNGIEIGKMVIHADRITCTSLKGKHEFYFVSRKGETTIGEYVRINRELNQKIVELSSKRIGLKQP